MAYKHFSVRLPCEGNSRKSFAAYYYTGEAPAGWDGEAHNTILKARPTEVSKRWLKMPLENLRRALQRKRHAVTNIIKKGLGRK